MARMIHGAGNSERPAPISALTAHSAPRARVKARGGDSRRGRWPHRELKTSHGARRDSDPNSAAHVHARPAELD